MMTDTQMQAKAELMAKRAIDKPFKIRLSKTSTVSGVINRCEVKEVRVRGTTEYTVWNVWMIAGFAKVEKGPYVMKALPQ